MKLKRKDSQIDSKSFVSWVYAVFQQHCMQKESVKLDKPVYAQMAILENSKILIYDSNTVQSVNSYTQIQAAFYWRFRLAMSARIQESRQKVFVRHK